ncbi:MAG: hypothetical protein FWH35_10455 [Treponema sp.]|nr:hypothetical protein [Treponema sp.]
MKRILVFMGIVIFCFTLSFIGCGEDGTLTDPQDPQDPQDFLGLQTGKVHMETGSNTKIRSVGINRSVVGQNEVEFLIWYLVLKGDKRGGGTWIISDYANNGELQNAGWYDIDGVNKQEFKSYLQGEPHSCFSWTIIGIRIGDTYFEPNHSMINFMEVVEDGTKDYFVMPPPGEGIIVSSVLPFLSLTAGDTSKFGPDEYFDPDAPNVPFDGVPEGYNNLEEFVIFVDEDKLYEIYNDEIVLKDNWWECFSFLAFPK